MWICRWRTGRSDEHQRKTGTTQGKQSRHSVGGWVQWEARETEPVCPQGFVAVWHIFYSHLFYLDSHSPHCCISEHKPFQPWPLLPNWGINKGLWERSSLLSARPFICVYPLPASHITRPMAIGCTALDLHHSSSGSEVMFWETSVLVGFHSVAVSPFRGFLLDVECRIHWMSSSCAAAIKNGTMNKTRRCCFQIY